MTDRMRSLVAGMGADRIAAVLDSALRATREGDGDAMLVELAEAEAAARERERSRR
jgi:hypothetical protein